MTLPFFEANVVECFQDRMPDIGSSRGAYWTRLAVPDGLPIFKEDRAWAEAIMAHFNPLTRRCFVVALGREEMIDSFLEQYPDGIGSGTPNDEEWAVEINPLKELDLSVVEGAGILVLNELPGWEEDLDLGEEILEAPTEVGMGEPDAPDSGASATEPGTGGSASPSETESPLSESERPSDEPSAATAGPTTIEVEAP